MAAKLSVLQMADLEWLRDNSAVGGVHLTYNLSPVSHTLHSLSSSQDRSIRPQHLSDRPLSVCLSPGIERVLEAEDGDPVPASRHRRGRQDRLDRLRARPDPSLPEHGHRDEGRGGDYAQLPGKYPPAARPDVEGGTKGGV